MALLEDYYAEKLAVDYNLIPQADAKYDAIELDDYQWNFRIAKQNGDNSRILIAADGTKMDPP